MKSMDVHDYLIPAARAVMGEEVITFEVLGRFADAIGFAEFHPWLSASHDREQRMLSEEWKRTLAALAGPHGRTLFKVMLINNGGNHDNRGNAEVLAASTQKPLPR